MCSECISDHKEHEWQSIKDAANLEKEKTENDILPAVENAIPKKFEEINRANVSVKSNRDQLKRKLEKKFHEIAEIAKKRRSELLEEVDKASLAKTTQLDIQREGLVKIKDALHLTLDTGTTVCSQYDSVKFLAVNDYIEKALQTYIEEVRSVELSDSNLTLVTDESILESLHNYGEISTEDENEDDSDGEEEESAERSENEGSEQESVRAMELLSSDSDSFPPLPNRRHSQGKIIPFK